jgi:predicted secreted protein
VNPPRVLALAALFCAAAVCAAEPASPSGVLNLAASAQAEVTRDLLAVTFTTSREGADAGAVQAALKQALDAALAEAKKAAKPGAVDVRTGNFSVHPRYAPKGQAMGWQGTAELVVEGRDLAAIGQLAGRITTLTVARVSQGLSREAREQVEGEVAAQAIRAFRAKASAYAQQFGYAGFTVRDVHVADGGGVQPVLMRAGAAMSEAAAAPLPVEAGKAVVVVSVNGSVQMTK